MTDTFVSSINVTGGDDAAKQFDNVADAASNAFKKIASDAQGATTKVSGAFDKLNGALGSVDTAGLKLGFEGIVNGAKRAGTGVVNFANNVGHTTLRTAELASSIVGTVAGFALFARAITNAARGVSTLQDEQDAVINVQRRSAVQAVTGAAQHRDALEAVNREFAKGSISVLDYTDKVNDLNVKYAEQISVQRQTAAAQEDEVRRSIRAKAALEQRAAFTALASRFGAQLANSLIQLGGVTDKVYKQLVNTFGPPLANLVDGFTAFVQANSGKIVGIIQKIVAQINAAFGGDALKAGQTLFQTMADAAEAAGNAVTNIIIPALIGLKGWLDTIANLINDTFGTKFTGGQLLAAAAILQFVGAFAALANIIRIAFGAFQVFLGLATALASANPAVLAIIAIVAVVTALYFALSRVDWAGFAKAAGDAVQGVVDFFAGIPATISGFFTDLWARIVNIWNAGIKIIQDAWSAFLDWFGNTALGRGLSYIGKLIDAFKALAAAQKASGLGLGAEAAGATAAIGAAEGGAIRGPGTSTSDSIPAWLSDGEFVMKARAVSKYGTSFMHAINQGRFSLGGLVQRFAEGGLVAPFAGPSLDTGAVAVAAGHGRPLNLTIGNETFKGLTIPDREAERLERFAIGKQTTSTGRKPAWMT